VEALTQQLAATCLLGAMGGSCLCAAGWLAGVGQAGPSAALLTGCWAGWGCPHTLGKHLLLNLGWPSGRLTTHPPQGGSGGPGRARCR